MYYINLADENKTFLVEPRDFKLGRTIMESVSVCTCVHANGGVWSPWIFVTFYPVLVFSARYHFSRFSANCKVLKTSFVFGISRLITACQEQMKPWPRFLPSLPWSDFLNCCKKSPRSENLFSLSFSVQIQFPVRPPMYAENPAAHWCCNDQLACWLPPVPVPDYNRS